MNDINRIEIFQLDIEANFPEMVGIKNNDSLNVLVVGAWRGDEIYSFLRWNNDVKVYAFEPNPVNFNYLQTAFSNHKNVHCFQMACGNEDGEVTLFLHNTDSGTESLLPVKQNSSFKEVGKEIVKVIKLDTFAPVSNISFDLFWIDVQGFELSVFQGAEKIMKSVKGIYVEMNGTDTPYEGAPHYTEIDIFLKEHGFVLAHQEMGPNPHADGGVALYIRAELISDYFSDTNIKDRFASIERFVIARRKMSSSWKYRFASKVLPDKIKAKLKRFVR
jgi:FkbM family methyltransferase